MVFRILCVELLAIHQTLPIYFSNQAKEEPRLVKAENERYICGEEDTDRITSLNLYRSNSNASILRAVEASVLPCDLHCADISLGGHALSETFFG